MDITHKNHYFNEYLSIILNMIAVGGIVFISLAVKSRFSMPKEIERPLGILITFAGLFLSVWAMLYIKGGILGIVKPRLNILVKDGPYKFIRHPFYLGMTIIFLGVTVMLKSWLGLVGVFILLLPCEIYRAELEDNPLFPKFGVEWRDYVNHTGFFLPFLKKR